MKHLTRYAIASAVALAASVAHSSEVTEVEPNHPVSVANRVDIDGSIVISGVLGNLTGAPVDDLDFFMFSGTEGDLVDIDIDGAWGGERSFDSIVAIFDTREGLPILRFNDDSLSIDEGSTSAFDSRIEKFRLPATGNYIVGVSNYPRYFDLYGGTVQNPTAIENGDYRLVISGVTSPTMQINIDIRPGSQDLPRINPKSHGKIPVAILGSASFKIANIDKGSLRFGAKGDERSLHHCGAKEDVNEDGHVDLVCHFENRTAGFRHGDLEGILTGKLAGGRSFEGRGALKVKPEKRR